MDFLSSISAIESRIQEIELAFTEPESPQIKFEQVLNSYDLPTILPHAGVVGTSHIADFKDFIKDAGAQYGVDPNLIAAVIRQESGGNANAKSPVGASGLMQLMPETARSLGVSDVFDPQQNINGGTRYLKGLLDQFKGNISLALAAYNAGSNAVKKYGGVPPYPETKNYVKNIMGMYQSNRKDDWLNQSGNQPGDKTYLNAVHI